MKIMRVKITRVVVFCQSCIIVALCILLLKTCSHEHRIIKHPLSAHLDVDKNPLLMEEKHVRSPEVKYLENNTLENTSYRHQNVSKSIKKMHLSIQEKFTSDQMKSKTKSLLGTLSTFETKASHKTNNMNNQSENQFILSKPISDQFVTRNVSSIYRDINLRMNLSSSEDKINIPQADVKQDTRNIVTDKLKRSTPSAKNVMSSIPRKVIKFEDGAHKMTKLHEEQPDGQREGFQLVNDKMTYVYTAHYDDREKQAEVKIITLAQRNINYNFTCSVHYPDQVTMKVTGYFKFIYASCVQMTHKHRYLNGFIICPVLKQKGRPSSLSLHKKGKHNPTTHIQLRVPSLQQNTLTRCNQPFINKYSNVYQLVWNTELLRMYGVEKFIYYLDDQSQNVVDMINSYVRDGIAEIRNISILQPGEHVKRFMRFKRNWAQYAANTDCVMSQVKSTKYVLFIDLDEVVVPRKHKTIVDLANNLLKDPHYFQYTGSLLFRNVYFPAYMEKTKVDFPQKDLALKYNIEPLLHTTRMKTSDIHTAIKSLVRPDTVDVMCIHQVFSHRPSWFRKIIDEKVATLHHYRNAMNGYMFPPKTEDSFMLKMSPQLISAVRDRLKKAGMDH